MFEKDKNQIFVVAPPFLNGRPVVLWLLRSAVLWQARPVHTQPPSPPPAAVMTGVRDFVAGLARAGKDFAEIQDTVKKAFGDKALNGT